MKTLFTELERIAGDYIPSNSAGAVQALQEMREALQTLVEEYRDAGEPVAVRHSFDGHGWLYSDAGNGSNWLRRALWRRGSEPLYVAPDASGVAAAYAAAEAAVNVELIGNPAHDAIRKRVCAIIRARAQQHKEE